MLFRLYILILMIFFASNSLAAKKGINSFTQSELTTLNNVKKLSIEKVEELQNLVSTNYHCYKAQINKSYLYNCPNFNKDKMKAKLTFLAKANSQYRLLTGLLKIKNVLYRQRTKFKFTKKAPFIATIHNKPFRAHILSNSSLKLIEADELAFSDFERSKIKRFYVNNQEQIFAEYKETKYRKKWDAYAEVSAKGKITFFERASQSDKQLKLSMGFNHFYKKKIKLLNQFYLNQIMSLVAKDPVLLFINSRNVSYQKLRDANLKYSQFLNKRIINLKATKDIKELSRLAVMYENLPIKNFKLSSGEYFSDEHQWTNIIQKINHTNERKKFLRGLVNKLLFVGSLISFFTPTAPAYGLALTVGFLGSSGQSAYKNFQDYQRNLKYWLSSLQSFQKINESRSKYLTDIFIMVFLGQPLIASMSKGGQLLSFEVEAVGTFQANFFQYIKAKAQWKAKGQAAKEGGDEPLYEDVDFYIDHIDSQFRYISSSTIDYEDYRVIKSGCLISNPNECGVEYY